MTRIRLALLAVAVGLGVPVAVLTWRALDGLALERAVRHQALAERAFDEMERALSEWLEDEEARPFEAYRFYTVGERRSPLAELPAEAFVVGAFQIDPDDSVHTPLRPDDLELARARGDWPPAPEVERRIEQITRLVESGWRDRDGGAERAERRKAGTDWVDRFDAIDTTDTTDKTDGTDDLDAIDGFTGSKQAAGTTRPIGGPLAGKSLDAKDAKDAKEEEQAAAAGGELGTGSASEADSVYEALGRLNRGAEPRADRKQKLAEAVIQTAPSAPRAARAMGETDEPSAGTGPAPAPARPPSEPLEEFAPEPQAVLGDTAAPRDERLQVVRVALDPMAGRPAGDDHLLLYRTVLVGRQGYRQGLVLDRRKLGAWLAERALGPSGLSPLARLSFDAADADAPPEPDAFVFQHRFAEPFDALSARLSLAALPGVGQPGAIFSLVAILAIVGAAGLLAVERMVAIAVHFAERRSNFVSAVTHELKTPLTAIRMYAEMLRDGLVTSEAKRSEYYGTITDESERLSRLIDNVLEFSRLSRGAREMDLRVGAVGPVLREAADKLRAHAAREGFALEVEVEPDLPPVRYDRDALLQVLFNLVDNAMKYARRASARRVLLTARRSPAGVELLVRDFGPGVPSRHLSRIFEPFYRGEDELTRSARGTGIGLALVRELADRMGAAVRGANAEGGGFQVCLAFPAERG